MTSGHGGVTIGSLMGGGVRNVYARGLTMRNSFWASNPLNIAIRIQSNLNRGRVVGKVHIRDVDLPHGVSLKGASYGTSLLKDSPINTSVPVGVSTRSAAKPSTCACGAVGVSPRAAPNPSTSAGGLITLDCDYMPAGDAIRIRPPVLRNIHISN